MLFFETVRSQVFPVFQSVITRKSFYFNEAKGFYCLVDGGKREGCMKENKGREHPEVQPESLRKLKEYFR